MPALVLFDRYFDPNHAHVVRGVIEQHGYFVTVFDEQHCRNQWPLTLGLGGLRLMVLDTEHDEVSALLDAAVTTPAGPPFDICPVCGGDNIFCQPSWIGGFVGLAIASAPMLLRTRRRICRTCKHRWHENGPA